MWCVVGVTGDVFTLQGEGTAEVGLGGRSQWIVEEKKGRVKGTNSASNNVLGKV